MTEPGPDWAAGLMQASSARGAPRGPALGQFRRSGEMCFTAYAPRREHPERVGCLIIAVERTSELRRPTSGIDQQRTSATNFTRTEQPGADASVPLGVLEGYFTHNLSGKPWRPGQFIVPAYESDSCPV
jgi:hypothetical protein